MICSVYACTKPAKGLGWCQRHYMTFRRTGSPTYLTGSPVVGRWRADLTHCPQGHPYDDENTSVNAATGHRRCKACHRDNERRRYREFVTTTEPVLVVGARTVRIEVRPR